MCVCVCAGLRTRTALHHPHMCVRVCVCVCARTCVVCVCARTCVWPPVGVQCCECVRALARAHTLVDVVVPADAAVGVERGSCSVSASAADTRHGPQGSHTGALDSSCGACRPWPVALLRVAAIAHP